MWKLFFYKFIKLTTIKSFCYIFDFLSSFKSSVGKWSKKVYKETD